MTAVKSTEQPEVKQVAPRPLPLMNLRQKLKTEAKYLKITQAKSNMSDKIKSDFTSFVKESRKFPVRPEIPYRLAFPICEGLQRTEIESSQGLLG